MIKIRTLYAFLILIFFGLTASACTGRTLTASSWPGLMATSDTAYIAYNNHVYAINLSNGTLKWQFPTDTERNLTFFARPEPSGAGQIIVGDYINTLHLLTDANGQEDVTAGDWPFEQATGRFISGPLVTETGIYAPSADGKLYALDRQANEIWEPFKTDGPLWAEPATDGSRLFLASMDHKLYALDALTGNLIWSEDLVGALVGTPAVSDDGVLYLGSFASEMVAMETETGRLIWRSPTNDWIWSGPTLDGDRLYFGDVSGMVYCLNRADGSRVWTYQADGSIAGQLQVRSETVYVTTDAGSLIALTTDGAIKWTQTVGGKLYSSPEIVDDRILVTAVGADALLSAYTLDGAQTWTFTPEN